MLGIVLVAVAVAVSGGVAVAVSGGVAVAVKVGVSAGVLVGDEVGVLCWQVNPHRLSLSISSCTSPLPHVKHPMVQSRHTGIVGQATAVGQALSWRGCSANSCALASLG